MTVKEALTELNEYGFHIVQINEDEFLVHDTGLFGFVEEEDPFVVDADELLEIHEQYLG
jgi:DNA-binding helix-hairpin-helix protein with protein kinase domain